MSSIVETKGSCLCGAVGIQATEVSTDVGVCHCSMCRKWTGGPFFAVGCQGEVKISGLEKIATYESSEWAERGFCSQCGTHLFYRLKQNNQYIFPAGLFETDGQMHLDHQIFIEEKPEYYAFLNETKNMTGEEVFAQFSGDQND